MNTANSWTYGLHLQSSSSGRRLYIYNFYYYYLFFFKQSALCCAGSVTGGKMGCDSSAVSCGQLVAAASWQASGAFSWGRVSCKLLVQWAKSVQWDQLYSLDNSNIFYLVTDQLLASCWQFPISVPVNRSVLVSGSYRWGWKGNPNTVQLLPLAGERLFLCKVIQENSCGLFPDFLILLSQGHRWRLHFSSQSLLFHYCDVWRNVSRSPGHRIRFYSSQMFNTSCCHRLSRGSDKDKSDWTGRELWQKVWKLLLKTHFIPFRKSGGQCREVVVVFCTWIRVMGF